MQRRTVGRGPKLFSKDHWRFICPAHLLEAADELVIDPSDRIAVRRFDEGPRLAAGIFTVALDDDDPAVLSARHGLRVSDAGSRRAR